VHGLDIEESASAGDAKLQQLLTAGSVDIGIGSGPGMAFSVKGVPAKAVFMTPIEPEPGWTAVLAALQVAIVWSLQ